MKKLSPASHRHLPSTKMVTNDKFSLGQIYFQSLMRGGTHTQTTENMQVIQTKEIRLKNMFNAQFPASFDVF